MSELQTASTNNYRKIIAQLKEEGGGPVGSGVLISPHFLVAALHVLQSKFGIQKGTPLHLKLHDEVEFSVPFGNVNQTYRASLEAINENADLILLKVNDLHIKELDFGIGNTNFSGQEVTTYGFPLGANGGMWVNGRVQNQLSNGLYQLIFSDVDDMRGFSGSPVFRREVLNEQQDRIDFGGIMVSVHNSKTSSGNQIAYMKPWEEIQKTFPQLATTVTFNESIHTNNTSQTSGGNASGNTEPEYFKTILNENALDENAISDTPVEKLSQDRLGFETYVKAFRNFIDSPDTATPLTISVEGPWGVGKSSMMRMLQSELKDKNHICVWFNAWKFDQEEEIWAALALAIFEEVKNELGVIPRLRFWDRLFTKRFSFWRFFGSYS